MQNNWQKTCVWVGSSGSHVVSFGLRAEGSDGTGACRSSGELILKHEPSEPRKIDAHRGQDALGKEGTRMS